MATQESAPALLLSYKSLEILLIVSMTVNFCVSWSVFLPKLCHAVLRGFSRKQREDGEIDEEASELPIFCRRL